MAQTAAAKSCLIPETFFMRLVVDDTSIRFEPEDSVLVAMLRAGFHPTGGGCLCLAGDCPHCLASVDGISYTRTCQVRARPGLVVKCHHADGAQPPLIRKAETDVHAPEVTAAPVATTISCKTRSWAAD